MNSKKRLITRGVRFSEDTFDKVEKWAEIIDYSPNQFIEHAVLSLIGMLENPKKRIVPDLVLMAEAVTSGRTKPHLLHPAKKPKRRPLK